MPKRFHQLLSMIALVLLSGALLAGCTAEPEVTSPAPEPAAEQPTTEQPVAPEAPVATEDVTELEIEDLAEGDGAEAKQGDTVTVHYTGWLTDGTKFDSSLDSGQPFQFTIGEGRVISGWEAGVPGMKEGGKRKLVIPPAMAYGEPGRPPVIPPSATLVFEVELVAVN